METQCSRCGTRLTVDDSLAGQFVRCGHCEYTFEVQAAPAAQRAYSVRPASVDALDSHDSEDGITTPQERDSDDAPAQQPEMAGDRSQEWCLRIPEGRDFGPVGKTQLDEWVRQGRISSDCELRSSVDHRWQSALRVYPMLQDAGNPFETGTHGFPPENPEPHRGRMILTLSIIGCIVPLVSVWSAVMGTRDLRRMSLGKMDSRGDALTRAGQAIAMVSSMIWVGALAVALLVALIRMMSRL